MTGGLAARRLAASYLLRTAASCTHAAQPGASATGIVADASTSSSMVFASGRLTWWRGFSSLLGIASPGSGSPAAQQSSMNAAARPQGASTAAALHGAGSVQASRSQPAGAIDAASSTQPATQTPQQTDSPAGSAADGAGAPGERRRSKWRLDRSIEWTPQVAAASRDFWQQQGATNPQQLKRLARWTEMSPLFRNLPQLRERMARWRDAARRLGRPEAEVLRLVLSERAIIEKGADPTRIIGNLIAIEAAFAEHNLNAEGIRRSRVLQNKTNTIVERIPMFIKEVAGWPIEMDHAAMLQRNPGLLTSHSTNFAVYGERVAALARWAPPGLDLSKVLVRAPTLLNLFPVLVERRYTALKALLRLDDDQMSQVVMFAPSLLSRRTETITWKIAYHRAYAEHRASAGFGDELATFYAPSEFPSRLCNLLLQSAERLQRLRYLEDRHAGNGAVLAQTGYSWARRLVPSWHKLFPDFPEWLATQPRDPGKDSGTGEACSYSSSDEEA